MTETKVILSRTAGPLHSVPVVTLPADTVKKYRIPPHQPLLLQVTSETYQVMCHPLPMKTGNMIVHEQFAEQLGIPDQSHLQISYSPSSNKLKLGPVLAILVSKISNTQPPTHKLNPFCEELILLARSQHILAYVTSIEQLLQGTDKVSGWTFYKNSWREEKLPFPSVVHNRIGSRKVENSKEFQQLKALLDAKRVHLFNRTFLNKWEVYEKLSSDRRCSPYLPQTRLFGPLALKSMLQQYSTVFVKPIHGSLGYGIYRINKQANGFVMQYSTQNGQIHKQFDRLNQLYSFLSKRVSPKKHIIQEGIPLINFQDRTVDFRVLMQKNKAGRWSVTSMVARMGAEHRFVSNVARGGEIVNVLKALSACGISQPKQLRKQLLHAARRSCEGIESSYKDQFGELGVDLAISRFGRIYLLEINSKPSKTDDSIPPLSSSKARPSVHRLLDYTQYLANHSTK